MKIPYSFSRRLIRNLVGGLKSCSGSLVALVDPFLFLANMSLGIVLTKIHTCPVENYLSALISFPCCPAEPACPVRNSKHEWGEGKHLIRRNRECTMEPSLTPLHAFWQPNTLTANNPVPLQAAYPKSRPYCRPGPRDDERHEEPSPSPTPTAKPRHN